MPWPSRFGGRCVRSGRISPRHAGSDAIRLTSHLNSPTLMAKMPRPRIGFQTALACGYFESAAVANLMKRTRGVGSKLGRMIADAEKWQPLQ